jgi:5-formyltetrahydrofolate cyclo-ligase
MSEPSLKELKKSLRGELRAARQALSYEERAWAMSAIAEKFLNCIPYEDYSNVAGYVAMDGEVSVGDLLSSLAAAGLGTCLPKVVEKSEPLAFCGWAPGDRLMGGPFNTQEPLSGSTVQPELLIVPLVGFSRQGARLGFGGGFYDRTIAELRSKGTPLCVGVAFHCQERHDLPLEPHDQRLDMVLTERDIIDCR